MSNQTITKPVETVICDFCNKEIDTKSGDYCYHHLRSSGNVVEAYKFRVTHFLFTWRRPNKNRAYGDYIQYDFHAHCFDNLMQKFLANSAPAPQPTKGE